MVLPCFFNPSNDMALAANVRQYRPPKRIQQMEADLAELARVWEGTRFAGPWGWSLATKQRYRQMGIPESELPSDEWLEELRRLSSREFACGYIRRMLEELDTPRLLGEEMRWIDNKSFSWGALTASEPMSSMSADRCRRCRQTDVVDVDFEATDGCDRWIFKSPWSSSGRGVFVASSLDAQARQRLQGMLSSQGGFVMDRFYADKVLDFAMEFFVDDNHRVDFLGYSVFHASEHGTYGYNYVESQEELKMRMGKETALFSRLVEYHREHLAETSYRGPVGIDMLMTADGRVHPCLEINFRMNMGILALLLHERYGSGCTIQLTPPRAKGFNALVEEGRLCIKFL